MPFKKGQSGNPGGRKKGSTADFILLCQRKSPEALDRILKVASDPEHKEHLKANIWICELAHGKPSQAHEVSGPNGESLQAVLQIVKK